MAVAAGEGQVGNEIGTTGAQGYFARTTLLNSQRPVGLNVRYAAGPVNVGVAYDKNTADMKTTGVYGSFTFGAGVKLMGEFEKGDNFTRAAVVNTQPTIPVAAESIKAFSIGLTAPLGPVTLRTGFLKIKSDLNNRNASKFGFGGDYNLSKRTNLYTTIGKWSGDRFLSSIPASAKTTPTPVVVSATDLANAANVAALNGPATTKVQFDFGVTHRF